MHTTSLVGNRHILMVIISALVTGILSGIICALGEFILPDFQLLIDIYPGVIFGSTMFLVGKFILHKSSRNNLVTLFLFIVFTVAGWRLSINFGYNLGGPVPYATAGAVGAFFIFFSWLLAWGVRNYWPRYLLAVVLAGTIGGLLFQYIDYLFDLDEQIWGLVLFTTWQTIVLLTTVISDFYISIKLSIQN